MSLVKITKLNYVTRKKKIIGIGKVIRNNSKNLKYDSLLSLYNDHNAPLDAFHLMIVPVFTLAKRRAIWCTSTQ